MARNVATMVANNGSFNCNAAKMLVTSRAWPQRDAFLGLVAPRAGAVAGAQGLLPGRLRPLRAADRRPRPARPRPRRRRRAAVDAHPRGRRRPHRRPAVPDRAVLRDPAATPRWALPAAPAWPIPSSSSTAPPASATTPCGARSTPRSSSTASSSAIPAIGVALERAIADLRYGTVAINHWPALGYGLGTLPWGGHPSRDPRRHPERARLGPQHLHARGHRQVGGARTAGGAAPPAVVHRQSEGDEGRSADDPGRAGAELARPRPGRRGGPVLICYHRQVRLLLVAALSLMAAGCRGTPKQPQPNPTRLTPKEIVETLEAGDRPGRGRQRSRRHRLRDRCQRHHRHQPPRRGGLLGHQGPHPRRHHPDRAAHPGGRSRSRSRAPRRRPAQPDADLAPGRQRQGRGRRSGDRDRQPARRARLHASATA